MRLPTNRRLRQVWHRLSAICGQGQNWIVRSRIRGPKHKIRGMGFGICYEKDIGRGGELSETQFEGQEASWAKARSGCSSRSHKV